MQNKICDILEILYNDEKVKKTLIKIFSGEYVTDRERKEAMKSSVDLLAKEEKSKAKTIEDIERIEKQANIVKAFIDSLKEVNF